MPFSSYPAFLPLIFFLNYGLQTILHIFSLLERVIPHVFLGNSSSWKLSGREGVKKHLLSPSQVSTGLSVGTEWLLSTQRERAAVTFRLLASLLLWCYEWIVLPPRIHMLKPQPALWWYLVIPRDRPWEGGEVYKRSRGWSLHDGISPHRRRDAESLPLPSLFSLSLSLLCDQWVREK